MKKLIRKGYGRIYVDEIENIDKVKDVIKEMDEFEYDYLPDRLIAHHSEYPHVTYTHKFCDLDLDKLTAACWAKGIKIWVFDSGHDENPQK